MEPPKEFRRIVNGRRYDVEKSVMIANDAYWDGRNFERSGTNRFLYKTPRGRYFLVTLTQWIGQRDTLEPVSRDEAVRLYEQELPMHPVYYTDAFPDIVVEDA